MIRVPFVPIRGSIFSHSGVLVGMRDQPETTTHVGAEIHLHLRRFNRYHHSDSVWPHQVLAIQLGPAGIGLEAFTIRLLVLPGSGLTWGQQSGVRQIAWPVGLGSQSTDRDECCLRFVGCVFSSA